VTVLITFVQSPFGVAMRLRRLRPACRFASSLDTQYCFVHYGLLIANVMAQSLLACLPRTAVKTDNDDQGTCGQICTPSLRLACQEQRHRHHDDQATVVRITWRSIQVVDVLALSFDPLKTLSIPSLPSTTPPLDDWTLQCWGTGCHTPASSRVV
jgi:hypothetical protein